MAFLRLFKPPKNQQFSYKPRFWDPKKEEAEQLRKRVAELENGGVDAMKTRISGGFRRTGAGAGQKTQHYRSARVQRSNYTLVIVMISLLVLTYIGYEYYFPDLDAWLTGGGGQVIE